MFDLIKARLGHGYQAVKDPTTATLDPAYQGFPQILREDAEDFAAAAKSCPTGAIAAYSMDLGKCIFCGLCSRNFPRTFSFANEHQTGASSREALIVHKGLSFQEYRERAIAPSPSFAKICKYSLALRNVCAGGCNACELELNACNNVNFDMGRYGIEVVASPRHADAVIVTGPLTRNMAFALEQTYRAIPEPKVVILNGSCAISGGIFAESPALERSFLERYAACLYLPGCPVHPLNLISSLMRLLGRCK
ncbi:MAG: NADH:ubiquinone oxidoreductase [Candidatus Cloacimonetes bacterium HGW-Cloacimonetes-1]|jgi:Ni,Fe-hydrogenase III small subunit/ferredoxin|nr:MAG: NADH:ubiquinone oxidoreductase [Candidatus Cloacimonetes bacterium HGW-Cloacimonetes-1]